MGPSQVTFLFLSFGACAFAMLPQGFNPSAGPSTAGMGAPMGGAAMGMGRVPMGMGGAPMMGRTAAMGMMAFQYQMYDRKRSMMKNLIKLYEKHGCVDPVQKFSNEHIPAAITMIGGCSDPRANISCRQYGIQKLNLRTVAMQNAMPAQQQQMIASRLHSLSPYNAFANQLLGRGLSPMTMRMVYGTEGPGSGLLFSGERLDLVKNYRRSYLPYQCEGIRVGAMEMGLCCPGQVSFNPEVEMRVLAELIHV